MKINRSASSLVAAVSVAFAAFGMTGAAHAQNVFWSVGLSSPGVQVGVANAPPMMVVQPMYQPAYQAPRPVVYVQPAPVFVAPPPYIQAGWQYPGQDRGWRHGHGRHGYERFESGRFEGERSGHGHGGHGRD